MKERSTRCPPKLRILSAFLAFAMLLTLLPVTAFAANVTRKEIDGLKYVQVNNYQVLWITGTYTGSATHLTLENRIDGLNVNRIYGYEGDSLFKNNQTLKSVTLPTNDYFYEIGDEAFAGCTNLETVVAPTTLGDVGERAFQGCRALKSLALGSHSAHIYESAFEGCTSLKSIRITGTMVYIEDTAFKGCTDLTSVTLPKYLEKMGNNVFEDCTSLEEITLPKDIREFGDNVFAGCTNLKKITYNGKSTDWANCPAKDKIPANVTVEFAVPLTEYGISVRGITVNEANCSNVLKDGKVEFEPTSNYLTLKSANMSYNDVTTAAIDDSDSKRVELTIMGMGYGNDTVENTSGPGIRTKGKLDIQSTHIVVKGTPAISAQSITMSTYNRWYRTSPNGPFVKYTEGSVDIGNATYFEVIRSQDDPNETGILLWINGIRMPEIEGWESYDVFKDGTALLGEYDYGVGGEKHCTLNLKNANWESDDIAILTRMDQLTISGTGTIKGEKNSIRTENTGTVYGAGVSIDKANLTFTGGLDLEAGASITNSTVKINDWTDYGIKAGSNLIIDGSDVTIASETGEYALCPQIVQMYGNSTLRLQGAKSIANGGDQRCIIYTKYWYRTSPDGEYTEGTEEIFKLNPSYTYYELTTIDPYAVKTYDLWVAGKQVTETNQSDVLGNGTVKFDPATNTLTLNNANLTLDADAKVNACIDSELAEELTITGTATLSNADGILTDGPLTLDNATLTLTGNIDEDVGEDAIRAGRSDEDITIQNSTVTIAGTNSEGNFFQYGIRCGNLTVANSTLDVKAYGSAIAADTMEVSGADTIVMAETDSTDEEEYYALALDDETSLTLRDGLALVACKVNESKTAKIARPEQAPTDFKVYWVVHPGDEPVNGGMQIPGAIVENEEEARLFEGWFLEDGTRLEDSRYYMGPGADHVGNIDKDVTFYGHWRTAESGESGESGEGGGDGFGTLLAVGAVVGVAGVVAYQVGTELILDQLLPAGVAVPHTRAELAMLLWNTAGRPAPATLPAFADVADPELAQAAQWAIEQGYLKARADGSFKPDKGVAKWRVIRGYRAVTEP